MMVLGGRGGWARRFVLLATLAVTFATTSVLWEHYWGYKFKEAHAIVAATERGVTFDGDWNTHHAFWCGLGDFGRDRGYRWSDKAAYRFGIPRVNARFGTNYRLGRGYSLTSYYTPARKHRIKAETLEEYSMVMRDKVLGDILGAPLWYLNILRKRIVRAFTQITPARLGLGSRYVDVPFSAWLFIPAFLGLVALRQWDQLKLLGFYLPTSLPSVLVYSGHGMTYGSAFHLVLFAVVVCWTVHGVVDAARSAGRPAMESAP